MACALMLVAVLPGKYGPNSWQILVEKHVGLLLEKSLSSPRLHPTLQEFETEFKSTEPQSHWKNGDISVLSCNVTLRKYELYITFDLLDISRIVVRGYITS